jgi:hypothetical protein
MKLIPDLFIGFPCEETQPPVGTKLAGVFESAGRIIDIVADVASATAGLDLTEAGWTRRGDEWTNQKNILVIQVEQSELQILALQRARDRSMLDLNLQRRQASESREVLDFLRDKFTSQDLYLFLQKETAALHYRMYELALNTARQAERAFNFERGHTNRRFLPEEGWSHLQEGLMAGERLEFATRRMDIAYINENVREHEIPKDFSLRVDLPLAYLQLRLTGQCEIELPEWRYDDNHPGMFMRRIRNVSLSIRSVVGPYTGIHCRLTLLSSMTRIHPWLRPHAAGCCSERDCHCHCGDGYAEQPNDSRVVRLNAARESIVTYSGQNDTGSFEPNPPDERYLRFEFQGAVSRWRIELPPENNQFDLDRMSEVVLRVNYTARDGGEPLRRAAQRHADCHVPGDGWCLFDVLHDFPDAWEMFRLSRHQDRHDDRRHERLTIPLVRDLFPFRASIRSVSPA